MAKGIGTIYISGKVGNLIYRVHHGQQWISTAPKFSREKYLHSPQYQTLRENNAEFGSNICLSSAVRATMPLSRTYMHLTETSNRLTHTLCRLKHFDRTSSHGQRSFALTSHPTHLNGFQWDCRLRFSNILPVRFLISYKHGCLKFTQPAFDTELLGNVPNYATHFRLTYILSAVPDFVYDSESKTYHPANKETFKKNVIVHSDFLPLSGSVPYHDYKLKLHAKSLADTTILASVKISYFSLVGDHYDECLSGSAAETLNGFVADPQAHKEEATTITATAPDSSEFISDLFSNSTLDSLAPPRGDTAG